MRLKEMFEVLETKTTDTFLSEMYDFLIEDEDTYNDLLQYYANRHGDIHGKEGFASKLDIECCLADYEHELGSKFKLSNYVKEKDFDNNEWFSGHAYNEKETWFNVVTEEEINEFKKAIKRVIELQFN